MDIQLPSPDSTIGRNLQLVVEDNDDDVQQEQTVTAPSQPARRYPERTRHPPTRYDDYVQH